MKYVYIDDSIQDRGGFIIIAYVFLNTNPDKEIRRILKANGFNPELDEFKGGLSFKRFPNLTQVRNQLKGILSNSKIAIGIVSREERDQLGNLALDGLSQFLQANHLNDCNLDISIDENFFKRIDKAQRKIELLDLQNHEFQLEQDSLSNRGIQLADLVAHTAGTMLLETLGLISKTVKAGDNSGYDPDLDINLGFELWATLRYNFLSKPKKEIIEPMDEMTYDLFPYGLYLSKNLNEKLQTSALNRFGEVYLGCIH